MHDARREILKASERLKDCGANDRSIARLMERMPGEVERERERKVNPKSEPSEPAGRSKRENTKVTTAREPELSRRLKWETRVGEESKSLSDV